MRDERGRHHRGEPITDKARPHRSIPPTDHDVIPIAVIARARVPMKRLRTDLQRNRKLSNR